MRELSLPDFELTDIAPVAGSARAAPHRESNSLTDSASSMDRVEEERKHRIEKSHLQHKQSRRGNSGIAVEETRNRREREREINQPNRNQAANYATGGVEAEGDRFDTRSPAGWRPVGGSFLLPVFLSRDELFRPESNRSNRSQHTVSQCTPFSLSLSLSLSPREGPNFLEEIHKLHTACIGEQTSPWFTGSRVQLVCKGSVLHETAEHWVFPPEAQQVYRLRLV